MYVKRRGKLLVSVMLSSYFFQLNVTTRFCRTRFLVISRFLPKIILFYQAVQFACISTRMRQCYSPVSQILQHADLSSPRKEGLQLFSSRITMVITVETRGVRKTSLFLPFLVFYFDRSRAPYMHTTFRTEAHSTSIVTVIMKMWRGRDVLWRTRDVPADLLSMGRKTSSFIDHCKKFRKAFGITLSQKCSWKTVLIRHLNGFLPSRTDFDKFQLHKFCCLCMVHCICMD